MAPQRHTDPFATNPEKLNPLINPYVDALIKADADGALPLAFGESLRGQAGHWRTKIAAFHDSPVAKQLIVEIGCHKGNTLIEMAKRFPDCAFLGIDITYKRVVMTAQRIKAAGIKNAYCILANAVGMDQLFAPQELNGLVLFFPDPWAKKKSQAKNRLVSPLFATRAKDALAPGGFFWFKTDQKPYFDDGGACLTNAGLDGVPASPTVAPLLAHDFSSTFEKRFKEMQHPTYGAVWQKPVLVP